MDAERDRLEEVRTAGDRAHLKRREARSRSGSAGLGAPAYLSEPSAGDRGSRGVPFALSRRYAGGPRDTRTEAKMPGRQRSFKELHFFSSETGTVFDQDLVPGFAYSHPLLRWVIES